MGWYDGGGGSSGSKYTHADDYTGSISSRLRRRKAEEKANGGTYTPTVLGPKEKTAQTIALLLSSDKKSTRKQGMTFLRENLDSITPRLKEQYFSHPQLHDYYTQAKEQHDSRHRGGIWGAIFGHDRKKALHTQILHSPARALNNPLTQTGLDLLGRLSDAQMEEIQTAKDAFRGKAKPKDWLDPVKALVGQETLDSTTGKKKRHLALPEALGIDSNAIDNPWARNAVKGTGFVGQAVIDPTNYLSFGGSSAARGATVGIKALGEVTARETATAAGRKTVSQLAQAEAEREIRRLGARAATTKAQREEAKRLLIDRSAAARTTRSGRVVQISEKKIAKSADKAIKKAVEFDRGGITIKGVGSLTPEFARKPVRGLLKNERVYRTEAEITADLSRNATERLSKIVDGAVKSEGTLARHNEVIAELGAKANLTDEETKALAKAKKGAYKAQTSIDRAEARRVALADAVKSGDPQQILDAEPRLRSATSELFTERRGLPGRVAAITGLDNAGRKIRRNLNTYDAVRHSKSIANPEETITKMKTIFGQSAAEQTMRNEVVDRTVEAARHELGRLSKADQRYVRDALDRGTKLSEAEAALRTAGKGKAADYLMSLHNIRSQGQDILKAAGFTGEKGLIADEDYLTRIYTTRGRRAMDALHAKAPDIARKYDVTTDSAIVANQGGHLKSRTLLPEYSASQVEATFGRELRDKGVLGRGLTKLREGDRLLEPSPGVATVQRAHEIHAADAMVQSVKRMETDIRGPLGEQMVSLAPKNLDDKAFAKLESKMHARGLQTVPLGEAGVAFAHPDIAPELANTFRFIQSPEALRDLGRMWDSVNNTWARYITNPVILGPAFASRNVQGNIWLVVMGGLRNPLRFEEMAKLQFKAWRASEKFPSLPLEKALEKAGVKENDIAKIVAMTENGIVKEGFARHDLSATEAARFHEGSGLRTYKHVAPSTVSDNPLIRFGTNMNSALEDNARGALWLDRMSKNTGDIVEAAQHTKKFLFDYTDLTHFESKYIKRVSKFYTFMRKSTPLVWEQMIANPGPQVVMSRGIRQAFGQEGLPEGVPMPEYLKDGAQGAPSASLSKYLGLGNPAGGYAVGGLDTPAGAADRAIAPLQDILSGKSAQKTAQDTLGMTSGSGIEAIKALMETATGASSFTGNSLTDQTGTYKKNPYIRALSLVFPVAGKAENLKQAGVFDFLAGRDTDPKAKLAITKAILGINGVYVSPDQQHASRMSEVSQLEALLRKLRESDHSVPTIQDLQNVGVVPRPERKSTSKSSGGWYGGN